jgi:hypothetical protein
MLSWLSKAQQRVLRERLLRNQYAQGHFLFDGNPVHAAEVKSARSPISDGKQPNWNILTKSHDFANSGSSDTSVEECSASKEVEPSVRARIKKNKFVVVKDAGGSWLEGLDPRLQMCKWEQRFGCHVHEFR